MSKQSNDKLRKQYFDLIKNFLLQQGEDVLQIATNELTFPCVDENNEDNYIVVTVKVPSGSRDGDPYDGYGLAEDYKMRCEAKAEKAAKAAEEKAKKIARDEAMRRQKAEAKAKREGQ